MGPWMIDAKASQLVVALPTGFLTFQGIHSSLAVGCAKGKELNYQKTSPRRDATRNDIEIYKAFRLLLRSHCAGKMEIYNTIITMIHTYNPRQGYNVYINLIRMICQLLVGIDSNVLNYLLSIIPLPQPCGQQRWLYIQEEVKRISGMSLLSIPSFHCTHTPVKFDNVSESNNSSPDSSDKTKGDETNCFEGGEVYMEEPSLEEFLLLELTTKASISVSNGMTPEYDTECIYLSNENSNEPLDLSEDDPGISELITNDSSAIFSVQNMAKFDLNPNPVLKESVQSFIAKVYGPSFTEVNGSLDETSKTHANALTSSRGASELEKVSKSNKDSLPSCSKNSSSILEVKQTSTICMQNSNQNGKHSKLKLKYKRCPQQDLRKVTDDKDVNKGLTNLKHNFKNANATYNKQEAVNSNLSKLQPFSYSDTHLMKEEEREKPKQNEQLKNLLISNNVKKHASPDRNMLQVLKNKATAPVLGPVSITKGELNKHIESSHNLLSDHEWSERNAKLLGIGLEQNEEVFPNKQDISIQNEISFPTTIIPSIPIGHGFKRYSSYTSAEHMAYQHELATSTFSELKMLSESHSCKTPSTPVFTENKATRNYSKTDSCKKIEATTVTVSAAPGDTHYKNDYQNHLAESWSTQEKKNNSLLRFHGMITPGLPLNPNNEENSNVCTGYNISKMRSYAIHCLPKSNNRVPMSPLPHPLQLPPPPPTPSPHQLPSSSSSLSLSSPFSIAHSIPTKHATTSDGQKWIIKVPESRKPMESLTTLNRPVYQPYSVYDSRFMQQRMQISQRPAVIAQPQPSMSPCLEQSYGYINQYGGRLWGTPVAHRMFPRQGVHPVQQQRMSTGNPNVIHFISRPTQRIGTNHPVYISQLPKMSPDVMPQYTSNSVEGIEEFVSSYTRK